jgi:hypothetical protein
MFRKFLTAIAVVAITSVTGTVTATASAAESTTTVATQQFQGLTSAQANAVNKAKAYLRYTAFSRTGLIEQLRYEGFAAKTATFAVDYIDVSWKRQAYKKAKQYLAYTSFSLSGLIDQLRYEGFTAAQARYGANRAY